MKRGELVSIIYTSWNRLEFTKSSLNELYTKTEYRPCELFVWDNDSKDGTREFLQSLSKKDLSIPTTFFFSGETLERIVTTR